jgi:hypothetical protein
MPNGEIWIPTKDTKGCGHIAVYNSDFLKTNGWQFSEHMKKTSWGGHDGYLFRSLRKILKPIRYIENDHYTRYHRYEGEWYKSRIGSNGKKIVGKWET